MNELLSVKKISKEELPFKLEIHLGNYCNYNCSYCISNPQHTQEPNYKKILLLITLNLKEIKEFLNIKSKEGGLSIKLIGGETTLYPVKEIFSIIKKLGIQITEYVIITNFSKPIEYFQDLQNFICNENKVNLKIPISYHEEFMKIGTLESKYLELMKFKPNDDNVKFSSKISFVITESNLEVADELNKKFGNDILFELKRFSNGSLIEKTEENIGFIREYSIKDFEVVTKDWTKRVNSLADIHYDNELSFKGMKCDIPNRMLHINVSSDNYVYLYNICKNTIKIKNNEIVPNRITCNSKICKCSYVNNAIRE